MECLVDMRVAIVVVEILLEVGDFDMDRGVELAMVNGDIDVQKSDLVDGSV